MTDQEWLQSDDPRPMIEFLLKKRSRKMRLAAVAACRLYSGDHFDQRIQEALEVAERFADGQATDDEREAAYQNTHLAILAMGDAYSAAVEAPGPTSEEAEDFMNDSDVAEAVRAAVSPEPEDAFSHLPRTRFEFYVALVTTILRDVFGPLTRASFDPLWLTSTVTALAGVIYDERQFDMMPILADALEDAGCTDGTILEHCRHVDHGGPHTGLPVGPHVRGCWVVDLIRGLE
jgi:hypothetical protein